MLVGGIDIGTSGCKVVLYNEKGEAVEFEQIFITPYKNRSFCILKPAQKMEGVGEDEGLVFELVEKKGQDQLDLITDFELIDAIFDIYFKLLEEQDNKITEETSEN